MFQLIRSRSLFLFTLLCLSSTTYALPTDKDQPIYVAADRASIDENKGITIYTGNVEIKQGSMVLKGDQVKLYRNADGTVERILSNGKPAYFEQQPQADQAITYATGQQLDYKVATQLMIITNEARIEQAGDQFTGAKIQYDMEKAQVEAYSDNNQKQRVHMVIQPRSKSGS